MIDPSSRGDAWMPLLRRLTEVSESWAVWKNVGSALTGSGDVDAIGSPADAGVIEAEFRKWAAVQGLSPVVVCPHIPGGLNLVALDPVSGFLFEVGVKERKAFRGSSLFHYSQLLPFMEMDHRGFRKVRPGVEGVLKLVLNGIRPGGRQDVAGLRAKDVAELLREDPAGAEAASALFGRSARSVQRAVDSVVSDSWDRGAAISIEIHALARALRHPGLTMRRLRFKLVGKRSCPVVTALLVNARHVPEDRESWLREVERTHATDEAGAIA